MSSKSTTVTILDLAIRVLLSLVLTVLLGIHKELLVFMLCFLVVLLINVTSVYFFINSYSGSISEALPFAALVIALFATIYLSTLDDDDKEEKKDLSAIVGTSWTFVVLSASGLVYYYYPKSNFRRYLD
jgi:hypothetical protein